MQRVHSRSASCATCVSFPLRATRALCLSATGSAFLLRANGLSEHDHEGEDGTNARCPEPAQALVAIEALVAGDASGCRCEKNGPLSASFARLPIWQYSQTLRSLESNITFRGALKSLEKRRQMQTSRLKKIFDLNSSKICKMLADIFAKVADFSNHNFLKF